jgi:arabinose-5-phosphate isomerase
MVMEGDVVLAISNSGESDEIGAILPAIKRLDVVLIAMTGNVDSSLGSHADIVMSSAVDQEACPLNLAPTASTTAQMALGDALAVALLDARGFREEDFARSHPGGSLGRKLLMHVAELMRSGDAVPRVTTDTVMADMLHEMTTKGLGFTAVCDAVGRIAGVFTDGDLRRLIETGGDLRAMRAGEVMSTGPKLVRDDALAVEAAEMMERHRVTGLLVVDAAGALVGALNSNDLMRAKVI